MTHALPVRLAVRRLAIAFLALFALGLLVVVVAL